MFKIGAWMLLIGLLNVFALLIYRLLVACGTDVVIAITITCLILGGVFLMCLSKSDDDDDDK